MNYIKKRRAMLTARRMQHDAEFEEGKHPRNEGGEFTSGSGGMTSSEHKDASKHHEGESNNTFAAGKRLLSVKHHHASEHHASAAHHLDEGNPKGAENSRGLAELAEKEATGLGGKPFAKKGSAPEFKWTERLFPSHTTKELEASVLSETDPARRAKIEAEIKARADGRSKPHLTPQVKW